MSNFNEFSKDTICVQGGYESKVGEARVLPIYQSTTYKYDDPDHVANLFDLNEAGHMYSRISNPTLDGFEKNPHNLKVELEQLQFRQDNLRYF